MTTENKGPKAGTVDLKLEVVVIPVSDVNRAKRCYENLGWLQQVTQRLPGRVSVQGVSHPWFGRPTP